MLRRLQYKVPPRRASVSLLMVFYPKELIYQRVDLRFPIRTCPNRVVELDSA